MTIILDPETEARLRVLADARGEDMNRFATVLLEEAINREEGAELDPNLTDEDRAAIRAGVQRGLDAEAAGRFRPFREYREEAKSRYGLPD